MAIAEHFGTIGRLITAAGRFAPTRRLALKTMVRLRAAEKLPRFADGHVNGRRIMLDLNEAVDAKLYVFGAFDLRGLKLMALVMKAIKCRTALDVGANIGNHTAFFCDWARQVLAFEPNPPIFNRLVKLIAENHLDNVTPYGLGLSDIEGELDFYTTPGAAGMSSLEASPQSVRAGTVPVRRGDDILRENRIANVDFIKIDVEGHEREVLTGLKDTITDNRPVIVAEFSEASIRKFSLPEKLYFLLPGYRIYGTYEDLRSRLFKTALSLQEFRFRQPYSHIVCIPDERQTALQGVLQFPSSG
jgi:FkbM family methyltransferase